MRKFGLRSVAGGPPRLAVPFRGAALLSQPLYTKGTAFSVEERRTLGLEGLLPSHVSTLDQQLARVLGHIRRKGEDLERYIGLAALQDRNECLFYRLLLEHIEEFLPIVYTPTVGLACQRFSHIFRRARGLWITPEHRGRVHEALANAPFGDVRLIVVTDNERVLGLGDQGAGGMGIPVGKLALYTAAAGIHPSQTLPVSLDVGTDNESLRDDAIYLGWSQPRLRGPRYDELVDEFVGAVKRVFPTALLQWEDFKQANALRLLDRYRDALPSFNDDVQGTAAVALAGLLAAARASGEPLGRQRVVFLGAGAAGIGIARLLRSALVARGVRGEALTASIAHVDSRGMLVDDRELGEDFKREFAWPAGLARRRGLGGPDARTLKEVVRALEPTALIGTAGQPGAFTEEIVRDMARFSPRPIVFPLSNPTRSSEAHPGDVLRWTEGRAWVATGSPFGDVELGGRRFRIGQANNVFIFPGVGLGAILCRARTVTDAMFAAAAEALAAEVEEDDLAVGALYPRIRSLRDVTVRIAGAVIRAARDEGLAREDFSDDPASIGAAMWYPEYPDLEPVEPEVPAG